MRSKSRGLAVTVLCTIALVLSLLCLLRVDRVSAEADSPLAITYSSPGPYVPAQAELSLTDSARTRQIDCVVHYPAPSAGSTGTAKLPLIIFSHGAGGDKSVAPELLAHWASFGFIVLAPTHADSIAARRRAGEKATLQNTMAGFSGTDGYRHSRCLDMAFILDNLSAVEAAMPQPAWSIDTGRIGMGGHSAGAMTSALMTGALARSYTGELPEYSDSRIKAALLLSPQGMPTSGTGMFHEQSWDAMRLPMMVMTGSLDNARSMRQSPATRRHPYEYAPAGSKYLLDIEGAAHMSFTGKAAGAEGAGNGLMLERALGNSAEELRQMADYDQAAIFDCIKAASLAFWLAQLNGDSAALEYLESGELASYPGVVSGFEKK